MDVSIKFEPSGREGLVPEGTYLFDAALRMGIPMDDECGRRGECDACAVTIVKGKELLSDLTAAEMKVLSESQRENGMRLSCQARIEKEGELVVMVADKQKTEEEKQEEHKKQVRKEFEELPLEKKVANLLELEMITLGETISFIMNSPYKVFGKVMDVMAEFGLKMDDDAKKAKRPAEHGEEKSEDNKKETKGKKKTGTKEKATEPVNEAT